ncbi:MAG: hypothetical protein KJO64_00255 [Bacteroidia bacterium]|nr:hypothetical protein [Bacteroidia bacterium]
MGKKARKKVKYTSLLIWLAIGIIGGTAIVWQMGNYGLAVLVAALCFAIGLASLVKNKKR